MVSGYKISVIVPVYNVEDYLREAIESVVNQTLSFQENIQLILVDNCSQDHSPEICREYADRYPENVTLLEETTQGVSAARNRGLDAADGEFVAFLDGDDVWDAHAFEAFMDFFAAYPGQVDVVAGRIYNFDTVNGYHKLDYKFKGDRPATRIVNIDDETEYDSIQSTSSTAIFRREAVGDRRFDVRLRYGEDSVFINRLILEKRAYGLAAGAEYGYRKRNNSSSAVNHQKYDPVYYIDTLKYYHIGLQQYSIQKFGMVLPYIQNVVYYDLAFRFFQQPERCLDENGKNEFMALCREILDHIDDSVFFDNRRHSSFTCKKVAYRLKYGRDMMEDVELDDENRCFRVGTKPVFEFQRMVTMCRLYLCEKRDEVFHFEGIASRDLFRVPGVKGSLAFSVGKKFFPAKLTEVDKSFRYRTVFGEVCYACDFQVDVPVSEVGNKKPPIRIRVIYDQKDYTLTLAMGKFIPGYNRSPEIFGRYDGYLLFFRRRKIEVVQLEKDKEKETIEHYDRIHQAALIESGEEELAAFRERYYRYRQQHGLFRRKKEVWLISDRVMNAGDNGEVFFKYLNKVKPWGIRPIFVISREADCVDRLRREGEVVFIEDDEYKLLFLEARKIISSGASEFTLNPFGEKRRHVADLFQYEFYYLQHGVACADLSEWLGKYKKNIHMLFTSSEKERNAFINGGYQYGSDRILLTGQARFDELYDERQKQILIIPTWRKSIQGSYDQNTTSVYFEGFKETEYFRFYDSLINDRRLLNKMREKGYRGVLCMHPIHKEQWRDFHGNDVFRVNEGYVDYNSRFAEAALAVTDYSSVIFDFAYLRKPIIYAQFDRETFFKDQTYDEGYFSYDRDGFGPVCGTLEATVDQLIAAVDRDCALQSEYRERMDSFFAFDDRNNCKRIYRAIRDEKKKGRSGR